MDIEDKKPQKSKRSLKTGSFVFIMVVFIVIVMVYVSKNYFAFLDTQLFQERKSHIMEFTDKASEIVDSVISYSWQQVSACEHVIKTENINSEEELQDVLSSTIDFIDEDNSIVIAAGQDASYYSSDHNTGHWPQAEMLSAGKSDMQQVVAAIPHKPGQSYFVFMKRLKEPLNVGSNDIKITHIAVATDVESMRGKISVNAFGDKCYTYLINKNGRRIYKYTYANNFIEGYNILNAFSNYNIVHGGTYNGFVDKLKQGKSTAIEFEFVDSKGRKENWYVANAILSEPGMQILLFVPTKVLGADTNMLMDRTVRFFAVLSAAILILVTMIVVTTLM